MRTEPALAENNQEKNELQNHLPTIQNDILTRPHDITPPAEPLNLLSLTPVMPSSTNYHQNIPVPTIASTSGKFVSPMEFMPPIKARPRNVKNRPPGKSMIATDTPEKNAIALKHKKKNKKLIKTVKQNLFTHSVQKNL